jgi:hypothetical protein
MEIIQLQLIPELCLFSQKHSLRNLLDDGNKELDEIFLEIEKLENSFVLHAFCSSRLQIILGSLMVSILLGFTLFIPLLGIVTVVIAMCFPSKLYNRIANRLQGNCSSVIDRINSACANYIKSEFLVESLQSDKGWAPLGYFTPPKILLVLTFEKLSDGKPSA